MPACLSISGDTSRPMTRSKSVAARRVNRPNPHPISTASRRAGSPAWFATAIRTQPPPPPPTPAPPAPPRLYPARVDEPPAGGTARRDEATGQFVGELPEEGNGSLATLTSLLTLGVEAATNSAGPRFFHFVT